MILGEVSDDVIASSVNRFDGEIVAVLSSEAYTSCSQCAGKVVGCAANAGRCGKCQAYIKPNKCRMNAVCKMVIEDANGVQHTVTAFGDQLLLAGATNSLDDIDDALMSAEKASFFVRNNILVDVKRKQ